MNIHSTLRSFSTIIEQLEQVGASKEFCEFWRTVLAECARSDLLEDFKNSDSIRESLSSLVSVLRKETPTTNPEAIQKLFLGAPLVEIPCASLPGNLADPTSPLGFFESLNPLKADDSFVVCLPYTLSILESCLQGPGMARAHAARWQGSKARSHLQSEIGRTSEIFLGGVEDIRITDLARFTTNTIDEAFFRSPLLAFGGQMDFYQHASRFYGQGELDYYKCGATSGFLIPEDYYGLDLYEQHGPGITKNAFLHPGAFQDTSIAANREWQTLIINALDNSNATSDSGLNPYRPVYFDSALRRIGERGGTFHNLVDVEQTGERLRERVEYWDRKGCGQAYVEDAAEILASFLRHPNVEVYVVRSFDTAWRASVAELGDEGVLFSNAPIAAPYLTSLLSDRICVYTSRGGLRTINRGFWVNPPVLEYFELSLRESWEMVPFYLLGLEKHMLDELSESRGTKRAYWLSKQIHDPTRELFSERSRISRTASGDPRIARKKAMQVIEELLRPRLETIASPVERNFLTLLELAPIFGRSYGRLRHWIADYGLGDYSTQAYDHRFARSDLERFVRTELAGRRGFPQSRVDEILARIQGAFEESS